MSQCFSPFESALGAARNFSNPLARSLVLVELAKTQFAAISPDSAWTAIEEIPNRAEKKGVLLDLALDCVQHGPSALLPDLLRRLVAVDPNSSTTAGRLALSLLERDSPDVGGALTLLKTTEQPFDTERECYVFFEKLLHVLMAGKEDHIEDIQTLFASFTDENYRDWSRLALVKFWAKKGDWTEAERWADPFSLPRRRSWAFFELARLAQKNNDTKRMSALLVRAAALLDTVERDTAEQNAENAEPLATQLRILGQFSLQSGERELGEQLLERCEAMATSISQPVPRWRAQLFLARTLWKCRLLDSVTEYIDAKAIWDETQSGIQPGLQRSLVLQWLAEAKPFRQAENDWQAAVQEAARTEMEARELHGDEFPQAERLAEIVKRYSAEIQRNKKTPEELDADAHGDPTLDVVNLSAAEFEDYYFSPFSIDDCGC